MKLVKLSILLFSCVILAASKQLPVNLMPDSVTYGYAGNTGNVLHNAAVFLF